MHLEKKYIKLKELKQQLENTRRKSDEFDDMWEI